MKACSRSRGTAPLILNLDVRWRWRSTSRPGRFTLGKGRRCLLKWGLDGPQNRFGRCEVGTGWASEQVWTLWSGNWLGLRIGLDVVKWGLDGSQNRFGRCEVGTGWVPEQVWTLWSGDWMGPRTGLDVVKKRKISLKILLLSTVGYATKNECYNEQYLSINSGCYNEHGGRLFVFFIRERFFIVFTKERLFILSKFTCTVYRSKIN
jgi:hypothetical protein